MAKKKPSQPEALVTYTARAKDLKILGHVEAADDKEALKKARKQYGAATVERRETAAANHAVSASEAPAAGAADANTAEIAELALWVAERVEGESEAEGVRREILAALGRTAGER